MARTTNPESIRVTAFFTPAEHREISMELASLGLTFTDYVLFLKKHADTKKQK